MIFAFPVVVVVVVVVAFFSARTRTPPKRDRYIDNIDIDIERYTRIHEIHS